MNYALAQASQVVAAQSIVETVKSVILYPLITLMMAVAMLVFVWGVFLYVKNGTEEASRSEGVRHMMWGVVGFIVMLSALAIFNIALRTFGLETVR